MIISKNKKTKELLWDISPFCRNCNTETIITNTTDMLGGLKPNAATIQHNLPKSHPNYHNDYTLWCHRCNDLDASYKQNNKIFSREELIMYLGQFTTQLNGAYIIDGVVFEYENHKLLKKHDITDYKFEKLREYINHHIDDSFVFYIKGKGISRTKFRHGGKKYKPTFEEYLYIKGSYSITKYHIGDDWYHYKVESGISLSKIEKRMLEIKNENSYLNKL